MTAVIFENVSKFYDTVPALDGVSFGIAEGAICGLLGANGAGKTTALRLMIGLIRADRGLVRILGCAPSLQTARSIGYLPEERGLYGRMSVEDNLLFFGELRGMSRHEARSAATAALKRFRLDDHRLKCTKDLSKGLAQRAQLALLFMSRPRLLVLDEPFSGLDPVCQQEIEHLLKEIAAEGVTILFSTHEMAQAQRLCDSLVLLAAGQVRFTGSVREAITGASDATGKMHQDLHSAFLHFADQIPLEAKS